MMPMNYERQKLDFFRSEGRKSLFVRTFVKLRAANEHRERFGELLQQLCSRPRGCRGSLGSRGGFDFRVLIHATL